MVGGNDVLLPTGSHVSSCPLFSVCTSMGAGTICGLYFWRILSFLEDTGSDVHIPSGMSSSGLLVS